MILRFCHLLYTRSQDHRTALHESARQGDVETSRWLLAAGADLLAMDLNNDTPDALVPIGSLCKNLFDQHRATVTILENIGALDISYVAVAHCAALSGFKGYEPACEGKEPAVYLHSYQVGPFFFWVPEEVRTELFFWAEDARLLLLAATSKPFVDLPDDCAGDILEYLNFQTNRYNLHSNKCDKYRKRRDMLWFVEHCSSPQAHAWARMIFAASKAVRVRDKRGK